MALINQHQAIALEVRQLLGDLRDGQHHAAQTVFSSVALPHGLQILGADDEGLIAQIVLKHARQRGRHDGFTQAHHVADHHAAAAVQVAGSDFDGAFLELEQLLLKPGWQAELAQTRSRLGAEVVSDVQIDMVRRNGLFTRPAGLDDGGQISRHIQGPALAPTCVEPLGELLCAEMIQHINIELAMARQTGEREVAAADEAGDGVVGIVAKQQVKLGVQRVGEKELDHDLSGTKLAGKTAQASFILPCRDAQSDLLAQMGGKLSFESAGGGVVDQAGLIALTVQLTDFLMRRSLHADQHPAHLARRRVPRRDQVVNGLPAPQVQIAHAKIGAPGDLHGGTQSTQQILINIVKYAGHREIYECGFLEWHIVPLSTRPSESQRHASSPSHVALIDGVWMHGCRLHWAQAGIGVGVGASSCPLPRPLTPPAARCAGKRTDARWKWRGPRVSRSPRAGALRPLFRPTCWHACPKRRAARPAFARPAPKRVRRALTTHHRPDANPIDTITE